MVQTRAQRLSLFRIGNLEPCEVLRLPQRGKEPVHLKVAGKPPFRADPVRTGMKRSDR